MKKLFLQTYGCQMAPLLHADIRVHGRHFWNWYLFLCLGVFLMSATSGFCEEVDNHVSEWSKPIQGLQCRITLAKTTYRKGEPISVRVEFRNASNEPLRLIDFQDPKYRGMLLGFNREPISYHIIKWPESRLVTLKPGEVYGFDQDRDAGELKAGYWEFQDSIRMIYDNTWVASHEKGDYWVGRMESPAIKIVITDS